MPSTSMDKSATKERNKEGRIGIEWITQANDLTIDEETDSSSDESASGGSDTDISEDE
jgi:hypothetical protein